VFKDMNERLIRVRSVVRVHPDPPFPKEKFYRRKPVLTGFGLHLAIV
jgi:hypothetical protein